MRGHTFATALVLTALGALGLTACGEGDAGDAAPPAASSSAPDPAAVTVAGADAPSAASSSAPDRAAVTIAGGDEQVATASVADWATWGTSVAVVTSVSEQTREADSLPEGGGSSAERGRSVTVSVDRVVWQVPEAVTPVRTGDRLELYTYPGWVETDQGWAPAVLEGQTRLELGEQALVVLADDVQDGRQQHLLLASRPSTAAGPDLAAQLDGARPEHAAPPQPGQSFADRVREAQEGR